MRHVYSGLFYAYFFLTCLVFFTGALVLYLVTLPFDRNGKALHLYSCVWAQTYLRVNPLWRVSIEGREQLPDRGAAVIVANHASFFDVLALYGLFRQFKWVAKSSLWRVPFVGWNLALNRHVAIHRGDKRSIGRMMERCERWLDRGVPVMLFPEGTRSEDGQLLPFKDGAFQLAVKKNVPVIPVAIAGTETILPKHGALLNPSGRCKLKVLPPVSPESCGGSVEALREKVRAAIAQERSRMTA